MATDASIGQKNAIYCMKKGKFCTCMENFVLIFDLSHMSSLQLMAQIIFTNTVDCKPNKCFRKRSMKPWSGINKKVRKSQIFHLLKYSLEIGFFK